MDFECEDGVPFEEIKMTSSEAERRPRKISASAGARGVLAGSTSSTGAGAGVGAGAKSMSAMRSKSTKRALLSPKIVPQPNPSGRPRREPNMRDAYASFVPPSPSPLRALTANTLLHGANTLLVTGHTF